jgi:hypothetical protein
MLYSVRKRIDKVIGFNKWYNCTAFLISYMIREKEGDISKNNHI